MAATCRSTLLHSAHCGEDEYVITLGVSILWEALRKILQSVAQDVFAVLPGRYILLAILSALQAILQRQIAVCSPGVQVNTLSEGQGSKIHALLYTSLHAV